MHAYYSILDADNMVSPPLIYLLFLFIPAPPLIGGSKLTDIPDIFSKINKQGDLLKGILRIIIIAGSRGAIIWNFRVICDHVLREGYKNNFYYFYT